jgi:hypothetical protein
VTELPRLADMYILSFLIWHGSSYKRYKKNSLIAAGMYPERTKKKNSTPNPNPMRRTVS